MAATSAPATSRPCQLSPDTIAATADTRRLNLFSLWSDGSRTSTCFSRPLNLLSAGFSASLAADLTILAADIPAAAGFSAEVEFPAVLC